MVYRINRHRVRHGNIYDTKEILEMVGDDRADLFYSDPPWGAGNLKYWDTINIRQNEGNKKQDSGNFDVTKFLKQVAYLAKKVTDGWVVIEYGQRWSMVAIEILEKEGLFFCAKHYTMYKSGSKWYPVAMLVFHTEESKPIILTGWEKIRNEEAIISWFIDKAEMGEGNTIMDFCCGMGNTARVTIKNKGKFIGNELNKKRLTKTIKSLSRDK